ncbi:MAG: magnesium/cobalt efflux protein, partial [Alcanivorax sp.]
MSDDYSDQNNGRSWLERVGQFFTSTPGSREELLDLMRSMRDGHVIDGDTLGIIEGAIGVSDMQVREI